MQDVCLRAFTNVHPSLGEAEADLHKQTDRYKLTWQDVAKDKVGLQNYKLYQSSFLLLSHYTLFIDSLLNIL